MATVAAGRRLRQHRPGQPAPASAGRPGPTAVPATGGSGAAAVPAPGGNARFVLPALPFVVVPAVGEPVPVAA